MTLFEAIYIIEQSHDLKTIDSALLCNLLNDYQVYAETPACLNILRLMIKDPWCYKIISDVRGSLQHKMDINLVNLASQIQENKGFYSNTVLHILKDLRNEESEPRSVKRESNHIGKSFSIKGIELRGKGSKIFHLLKKHGFSGEKDEIGFDDGEEEKIYYLNGTFAGTKDCTVSITSDFFDYVKEVTIETPHAPNSSGGWTSIKRLFQIIKESVLQKYPTANVQALQKKISYTYDSDLNEAYPTKDKDYLCTISFGTLGSLNMYIFFSDEEIWIDCNYYPEYNHIVSYDLVDL